MDLNLTGKRVLVTGGNSGLGAAIVRAFAGERARVAINYVAHAQDAEDLVSDIEEAGGSALALRADVSDAAQVAEMFTALDDAWGGIDILVNNAGLDGKRAVGWEAEADDWSSVIDVNLKGAFLCAREALKRMVTQESGVIVNTSSVHQVIAWAGYSAYVASKAGLAMMSETLAQEAAPHGVRVLCIAPGAIRTPINKDVWQNPANYKDLLSKIPLGRMGTPDEIAQMTVVLASGVASYMTATTVFVDGGMTDYPSFEHGG